jgi:hypothetical protein
VQIEARLASNSEVLIINKSDDKTPLLYSPSSNPTQQQSLNMEIKIPDNLHLQIRKIRNIEVWRSDLIPLMMDGVKIQSVAVNAYGAVLQEGTGSGSRVPGILGGVRGPGSI